MQVGGGEIEFGDPNKEPPPSGPSLQRLYRLVNITLRCLPSAAKREVRRLAKLSSLTFTGSLGRSSAEQLS